MTENNEDKPEQRPQVACGAIIYRDNKEIFLGKSTKWNGLWSVPSGHLETGETFEECIKREVKEETGMEIDEIEFLQVQEMIHPKEYSPNKHLVLIDLCARVTKDKVILNKEEHTLFQWIDAKKALREKVNPFTRNLIEKFLEKKY